MNPNTRIDRRTALKGIGGAVGAATLGGAVLFATGPAAAASQDYGSVTITSDDGTVEYVAIYGDSVVTWDGFDTEAAEFSIGIAARVGTSGEWTTLHQSGNVALDDDSWGNYDESLSGPGTSGTIDSGIGLAEDGSHDPTIDWHIVGTDPDGYGMPDQGSLDPTQLEVTTDGGSENYTVQVRSVYTWYDASGAEIFTKTFTAPVDVTVNNVEQSASGSGTGGSTGA